ncbi:MAG: hypothetical protein H6718_13345 [Polyangiaceae bacterium]|nr:hypothetical protein [Polyangiaceae bacterium]
MTDFEKWPRLFLDSAELIHISQSRVDSGLVRELLTTVRKRYVVLLISVEHMLEALPQGDTTAVPRLADTLEQFEIRALVTKAPHDIEPTLIPDTDIEIQFVSNIREVLMSPAARSHLDSLDAGFAQIHEAIVNARAKKHQAPMSRVPARHAELYRDALEALARNGDPSDPSRIVAASADASGTALTPDEEQRLSAALAPVAEFVASVRPLLEDPDLRRRLANKIPVNSPLLGIFSPGTHLAFQLSLHRAADPKRRTTQSDIVDALHVMHFPYVDVATCDRNVLAGIQRALGDITGPRIPKVFRNGQLTQVVRAIHELPFPHG